MPSAATRTAGPQGTYTGVIVSLLRTAGRFRRSEGGQERQSYERMSCKRTAYRMARQLRRPPENPEPSLDGPHTGLGSIRAARTIKINNGAASEARTTHEGKKRSDFAYLAASEGTTLEAWRRLCHTVPRCPRRACVPPAARGRNAAAR